MELVTFKQSKKAAKTLQKGGIIAFPTETVYGLGVVYNNEKAYKTLIKVKRRPPEKPFTMMLSNVNDLEKFAVLNETSKKLIKAFMPGQFTLITEARTDIPNWCKSNENLVGLRIPDLADVRKLIKLVGCPLLVPSANKSGDAPANKGAEVVEIFGDELDLVIDGESNSKTPSTIVQVIGDSVKIIREGLLSPKDIEEALK